MAKVYGKTYSKGAYRLAEEKFKSRWPGLCGARKHYKSLADGLCKRPCEGTGGRCKYHGGMSLKGMDQPMWKHGKYSKYARQRVLDLIEKHRNDPDIRNLRSELSILKGLLSGTIETRKNLLSRDSQERIVELVKTISTLIDTIKRVEEGYTFTVKNVNNVLVQIVKIIQKRVNDPVVRRQIAGDIREMKHVNT